MEALNLLLTTNQNLHKSSKILPKILKNVSKNPQKSTKNQILHVSRRSIRPVPCLFSILIFLISLFQFRWFFEDVVAILAYEHHHDAHHCLVISWFLKELFIKRHDAHVIS